MVASVRRRLFRLHTSVNRKSCATRWMGELTVRVKSGRAFWGTPIPPAKAGEGAEKSLLAGSRTRRGQRRGKKRSRASKSVRGGKPRTTPCRPLTGKNVSSRKANHSGRKFTWFERTSAKIANSRSFKVVEEKVNFSGGRFGDPPLRASPTLSRSREWRKLQSLYSPFRRRAKAIGFTDRDNQSLCSLWRFVQTRSKRGGSFFELMTMGLRHLDPEAVGGAMGPPVPPPPVPGRNRGDFPVPGMPMGSIGPVVITCRVCGYLGPGPHTPQRCQLVRQALGMSSRGRRPTRGSGRR